VSQTSTKSSGQGRTSTHFATLGLSCGVPQALVARGLKQPTRLGLALQLAQIHILNFMISIGLIQNGNAGQFFYSSDLVNWGYISGLLGYYGAVSGSNFVGRTFTGSTTSTYTLTGTGYTTATQFPVPNLLPATGSSFGTFAPAPIAYIKT
jgi:hypothetical protein